MSLFRLSLIGVAALSLSACVTMEDVNGTLKTAKEKITQIEMPSFKKQGDTAEDTSLNDDAAPFNEHALSPEECLTVNIAPDLGGLTQFTDDNSPVPESMISQVTMSKIDTQCQTNTHNIVIDLNITFTGTLGPQGRNLSKDTPEGSMDFIYPYFLAITAPNGTIIAKEVFAVPLSFQKGDIHTAHIENIRQIIPTGGALYNKNTTLTLGFQLSPMQLAYNRAHTPPAPMTPQITALPPTATTIPHSDLAVSNAPVTEKLPITITPDSVIIGEPAQPLSLTTKTAAPAPAPAPTAMTPSDKTPPPSALNLRKPPAPAPAPVTQQTTASPGKTLDPALPAEPLKPQPVTAAPAAPPATTSFAPVTAPDETQEIEQDIEQPVEQNTTVEQPQPVIIDITAPLD